MRAWGCNETHVLVPRQPTVVLGFVRVQIVEDDMDVAVGVVGDNAVHEVKKFDAPTAAVVARPDHPGGDVKSGKQHRRAVPLVGMAEPGDRLAIGQLEPALGTLQRLDMGFFVDRQHHGVFRRRKYSPTTSAAFWAKLGSVLMHQLRRRASAISCRRSPRQI